jgi:hypothetical protein
MAFAIQIQIDIREQGIVGKLFQKLDDAFVFAADVKEWGYIPVLLLLRAKLKISGQYCKYAFANL